VADPFDEYAAPFRASLDRARVLAGPLSDEQFNWKPAPDVWSVGECLAHLNVADAGYEPVFEELRRTVRPLSGGPGPLRYGFLGRLFVRSLRPGSRPMKSPRAMRPEPSASGARSALDRDRTLAEFERHTRTFLSVVEWARGVDAGRVRVGSPFLPVLRLPLPAVLDGLGQHALRHVGQAERVTARPGFPR
jgi:hypothetical protein